MCEWVSVGVYLLYFLKELCVQEWICVFKWWWLGLAVVLVVVVAVVLVVGVVMVVAV